MAVAVAVVALAVTAAASYEQSRQAKAAAKDRREAASITRAEQAAQQNQSRRQQVREERVRRAQILQSAQNTGVSQSSGELGATSALGSLISGNLASMSRQNNSVQGIGAANQSAADADLRGAQWGAIAGFSSSVFGAALGGITSGSGAQPTQVKPTAVNATQGSIFGNYA